MPHRPKYKVTPGSTSLLRTAELISPPRMMMAIGPSITRPGVRSTGRCCTDRLGSACPVAGVAGLSLSDPWMLLVDSTGLRLCGAGEWLDEKYGTKTWRLSRKLHLGMDPGIGKVVATLLSIKDVDDGSQVGSLLSQVEGSLASFTGDGSYDQGAVSSGVVARHPKAIIIMPPRSNAVPSETKRARIETGKSRFKQMIVAGSATISVRAGWETPQSRLLVGNET